MDFKYDVIVIGAGHAGCEAAAAAAQMGSKTCLITMDMNKIAQMSCNPAVGGIAKGQIVREIDALGGHMGLVTDSTAIQFRILNRSKGPAMWSPRAQCDRAKFIWAWRNVLENQPNLNIWQDTVTELLVKDGQVVGLKTLEGAEFSCKCVVLTAGTFLNGLMHIGRVTMPGGRISEPASYLLTESITRHGIRTGRMKTGTPVRIDSRSVHFEEMERQDGENDFHRFSFMGQERHLKQMCCWTTYTNERVHEVLRSGLKDSPLFNGQIKSIGPRYCPSIETKLVTVPVSIIGSFAAKIFRYPQTNGPTRFAHTNHIRYITKTSGHLQPFRLRITQVLATFHRPWQNTGPRLHLIRNLLESLMTKTLTRSRTVGLGTDSPPFWYFLKLYHIICVFFQLSQADICLPEG